LQTVFSNTQSASFNGIFSSSFSYSFRLKAFSNFNTSAYSQTVNATPNFPAPSLLKITSITRNSASMQWQDNSNNESLFEIFRSIDGINFSHIQNVGMNSTATTILGPYQQSIAYYFKIRAKNALSDSGWKFS
jgi:titin